MLGTVHRSHKQTLTKLSIDDAGLCVMPHAFHFGVVSFNSRWDCLCWIEVRYILGYEILEYLGITRYFEGRKFNTVRTGYILALNQVGLQIFVNIV
jgi:hypothetical protein